MVYHWFIKKNSISDGKEITSPVQWLGNKDPKTGDTFSSSKEQIVSNENTLSPQDLSNQRELGVYCLSDEDIKTMNCDNKVPIRMKVGDNAVKKSCSFKSTTGGKRTKKRKI